MRRYGCLALAALIHAAAPLAAQRTEPDSASPATIADADLPAAVAERLTAFFNDPATIHFTGRTRIPADRVIQGDVGVLGGPLTIAGRIDGRVVVINGDVDLLPGAEVTGDLTVVGGTVTGTDAAKVGGEIVTYGQRMPYRRAGENIAYTGRMEDEDDDGGDRGASYRFGQGRADFVVATGQSYNRVEGMPITFGPVIETEGRNPLRLRAYAIYRTEEGARLGPDRWGYDVRLEQFVGGERALRIGASLRRVVDPIEGWHLSKLENGLATFFLHDDYRDHYERRGWSGYATWAPQESPLSVTAEYRDERNRSLPAGSPWTLFKNDEPWRAQPLVAEGVLRSVTGTGAFDTRNDRTDPSTGWYVQGVVERSVGTNLHRPAAALYGPGGAPGAVLPEQRYGGFTSATVDLRRYNRISPTSRLNLRFFGGGALSGNLPPQRQHALGGEGSLPGYRLFELDCGARAQRYVRPADVGADDDELPPAFYAAYGCDRFALAQAEYRGSLHFRINWNGEYDDDGEEPEARGDEGRHGRVESWTANLQWVAFMDAGRAWAHEGGRDEPTAVDAGFGVMFGRFGIYGAVPLEGGRGVNVFIRLNPRF
jgi:hypothetical protein